MNKLLAATAFIALAISHPAHALSIGGNGDAYTNSSTNSYLNTNQSSALRARNNLGVNPRPIRVTTKSFLGTDTDLDNNSRMRTYNSGWMNSNNRVNPSTNVNMNNVNTSAGVNSTTSVRTNNNWR